MVPGTHIESFLSRMLHPPHFFKEGMLHSCEETFKNAARWRMKDENTWMRIQLLECAIPPALLQ